MGAPATLYCSNRSESTVQYNKFESEAQRLLKWAYIIFLIFKNVYYLQAGRVERDLSGREQDAGGQGRPDLLHHLSPMWEAPFKQIRPRLPLYRSVRGSL